MGLTSNLRFTNRWDKPIEPVGTPKPPTPGAEPTAAAEEISVNGTFTAPTGE